MTQIEGLLLVMVPGVIAGLLYLVARLVSILEAQVDHQADRKHSGHGHE